MDTQNHFRIFSTILLLGVSACDPEGAPELIDEELLAEELEAEIDEIDAPEPFGGSRENLGEQHGLDEIDSPEPETTEVDSVDLGGSDFNNDGFADLAMGAPGQVVKGVDSGAVIVSYGGPGLAGMNTTLPPRTLTLEDAPGARVPSSGDEFGRALAAGDFNLDGFDDLAIGAPSFDIPGVPDQGAVIVVYGSVAGLGGGAPTQFLIQAAALPGDSFGAALAAQDFGGDGGYDLAVGVPHKDPGGVADAGEVHVYVSTAAVGFGAVSQIIDQTIVPLALNQTGDRFGAALATGNFNGDARHDLAIGTPGDAFDGVMKAGSVSVLYANAGGSSIPASQVWHQNSPGIAGIVGNLGQAKDEFGSALVAGNFDGNPFDDLAVGIPLEDVAGISNAGAVMVLYSNSAGLGPVGAEVWHQDTASIVGVSELDDYFGKSLAAGQLDALGWDDLAIGVPGEDLNVPSNAGMVNMIFSSPMQGVGLTAAGDLTRTRGDLPDGVASEVDAAFGSALSISDYDGNGVGDLAVGAPFRDNLAPGINVTDAGEVNVLWGPITSNAAQRLNKAQQGMFLGAQTGDMLGAGLPSVH